MKYNSKKIRIAILLAVFSLTHCQLLPWSESSCIQDVLQEDAYLADLMRQKVEQGLSKKKAIQEMTKGMRSINMNGCPNDFKRAYLSHIHAWESYEPPSAWGNLFKALLGGFIAGATGDFTLLIDSLREDDSGGQINETWEIVEKIAIEYDVDPGEY